MDTVTPEEVGLSSTGLKHLRTAAQGYVDEGKLADLITLIARQGKVVHLECHGMRDAEANKPMQCIGGIKALFQDCSPSTHPRGF